MCDKDNDNLKVDKGDEDMTVAEQSERIRRQSNSQSNSFLKLRHKMQTQMKKKNISYDEILKMTEEARREK